VVGFGDAYGEGVDDVAYTKAVIAQVGEAGCIDLRRCPLTKRVGKSELRYRR
jgi:hypothetical protein